MPRVIHFEIPSENPVTTVAFYEQALGWRIAKWDGPMDYWLVCTGEKDEHGINGAIMRKTDAYGVRNTIGVNSIRDALGSVQAAGGHIIMAESPIEGVDDWALCEDPDGNYFALAKPHDMGGKACRADAPKYEVPTPRVVHFEIPSDNPDLAARFYQQVFGWEISKWEGPMDYWLVHTGSDDDMGIDGGLMRREDDYGVRNTIAVADLSDAIHKIEMAGGRTVVQPDRLAGVGEMALCEDPDGNPIGLLKPEEMMQPRARRAERHETVR